MRNITTQRDIMQIFKIMYSNAYGVVEMSSVNIEYVVKPPRSPVKIKALRLTSLTMEKSRTIATEPIRLQISVAIGKEMPSQVWHRYNKSLKMPPKPEPMNTKKYCILYN